MDQHIGNYLLLHPLGQSDFSVVFLGEHRQRGTQVAIKLLHGHLLADEADVFLEKTAALSQLQHPHIMPIRDFGVEDGMAFIVMDYAAQGTLRHRHPRGTRVPLTTIPQYVESIAAALTYLNEQGLVHRDIKPHNLLIDAQGTILLSDFGAAISSYSLHPEQETLQDFEGTVLYAAPEQLQGRPCRASDQYALGVVVYEWICGNWPFNGTFHEVVHQHLFVTPPAFSTKGITCPANIERIVMRALEKEPEKRFSSVKLFADELIWACKVAQARGEVARPDITPLALPMTPPSIPTIQVLTPKPKPKRQFRSPLPSLNSPQ
jgi:serine/threonine protein kinase